MKPVFDEPLIARSRKHVSTVTRNPSISVIPEVEDSKFRPTSKDYWTSWAISRAKQGRILGRKRKKTNRGTNEKADRGWHCPFIDGGIWRYRKMESPLFRYGLGK